jgi:hypothetical protein
MMEKRRRAAALQDAGALAREIVVDKMERREYNAYIPAMLNRIF